MKARALFIGAVAILVSLADLNPASRVSSASGADAGTAVLNGRIAIFADDGPDRDAPGDRSGVVVWLENGKPAGRTSRMTPAPSTLLQRDKTFIPNTLAIPVGGKVVFPNQDDIYHNVFSLSPTRPFDLGLYKTGTIPEIIFRNPGVLRIFCNIHSQMFAFIYVFDHPFFATSGRDGSFRIESIPPGRYRVMYSYRAKPARLMKTLQFAAGATEHLNLSLNEAEFRIQPHANKFGQSYKEVVYKEDTGEVTF